MKIGHIAIWTEKLDELKDYYMKFFNGTANEKYYNPSKNFESYFISFESGAQLELMKRPDILKSLNDHPHNQYLGLTHFAFEVDSAELVDQKVKELSNAGFPILSGPRKTGDGYYEFETLDPDGNRIEVTYKK